MAGTRAGHRYAIALGSNRALSARLSPARLVEAAAGKIAAHGRVLARSPLVVTDPVGPSLRRYVNAALVLESLLPPQAMLAALQRIESALGRRRQRRWGARTVDIDIILWSGGPWQGKALTIPHPAFRGRDFVLAPLAAVAPAWRDPLTGRSVRHLRHRLRKPRPKSRQGG